MLELIQDTWRKIGIDLFPKPSQIEVMRNRIFSGDAQMSLASGIENGFPTADMSPQDFAPTTQQQYEWPKWGQYLETGGEDGQKVDLPKQRGCRI